MVAARKVKCLKYAAYINAYSTLIFGKLQKKYMNILQGSEKKSYFFNNT